jgi:steroid delta-isomerase-like uncharacterized protein
MSADPKSIVQRLYDEVWNKRKIQIMSELVSPSHSLNIPNYSGSAVGPEAYKQVVVSFMIGFPDFQFVVEDIITDKNNVVCRWTFSGTHKGEYRGIAATNKKVSVDGITIHHLTDGRIMDTYSSWDVWGMMHQLGVVRALGQPQSVTAR